jgi:nucleotidyltransferase/DNA polymerase involved in DNA repair
MSDLTPAALRLLAAHHGVITTAQLRSRGVGYRTQMRLVERGVLRGVHKGVFVIPSTGATLEQRCVTLCAAHPDGFVTGPTAGTLTGLRRMPAHAPLHFSIRHGARLPPDLGVHFRQTTALRPSDRVRRHDGIVVASAPRLAFDLAADLRPLDHLSVLQQLLHEKKVRVDELVAIERRLGHPARPGSGLFRRNLERLNGSAPNESHHEVRLAEALRTRGVPIENQSRVVRASSGRTARVDLAVPAVRWGIELDIHPEHRTFEGHANDARRVRDLHVLEWQVEPVTESDMHDLDALADELVRLYRARCEHRRVS